MAWRWIDDKPLQGSTLRHARMPGACKILSQGTSTFVVTCLTGQVIFHSGHVLIFSAVYISFTGLVQILAGHVEIFAGHVNFLNHLPDGHVNQMLNVKPCIIWTNADPIHWCIYKALGGDELTHSWQVSKPWSLETTRTPDLHIFLVEKMRMGVFGQERGEISAFKGGLALQMFASNYHLSLDLKLIEAEWLIYASVN